MDFIPDNSSRGGGPPQPAIYNPMNQRSDPSLFSKPNAPPSDYNFAPAPQKFMTPTNTRQQQQPPPQQQQFMNPADFVNNPAMAEFALSYGQNLAKSGGVVLNQRVERFLSVTKLKHYFAVDTNYVLKKLKILTFPFTHKVSFNLGAVVFYGYSL